MTSFNYQLNQDCRLTNPIVGDAEIREILFQVPNMRLRILQPFDGTKVEIVLLGLLFLFFHTDHPQNVIESISIHESWEGAKLPAEVDADALKKEFGHRGKYIVVINSIVGGPLVCGSCGLEIFCDRAS